MIRTCKQMLDKAHKTFNSGDGSTALSINQKLHSYVIENAHAASPASPAVLLVSMGDAYAKKKSWQLARHTFTQALEVMPPAPACPKKDQQEFSNNSNFNSNSNSNSSYPVTVLPVPVPVPVRLRVHILERIAMSCMNLRDLDGAMEARTECITILNTISKLDPMIPHFLKGIAEIHAARGCLRKQLQFLELCFHIQEAWPADRKDPLSEARTASAIGSIHRKSSKLDDAIEWYEKSLEKMEFLGEDHVDLLPNLLIVAKIHHACCEWDLSLAAFAECKNILYSNPDHNSGLLASILYTMGTLCDHLEDERSANLCYEESLAIARPLVHALPRTRLILAGAQIKLAIILQNQGKTCAAKKAAEEAIEYGLLEPLSAADDKCSSLVTSHTFSFLIQLYAVLGDTSKVNLYSRKLMEFENGQCADGEHTKRARMHGAPAA